MWTRARFNHEYIPGLFAVGIDSYMTARAQSKYRSMCTIKTSRKAKEEDTIRSGLGLPVEKHEGAAVTYDTQIGGPKHEGYTSEEMKMVWETQKIFDDASIQVCPTCVRVPVGNCHSESILVETEKKISAAEARELFAATPGIAVVDDLDEKQYPMPINCDERDEVFVGRIREDISGPNGLAFWCVSDNLRKGAATNAVQIAEWLLKDSKTDG